MSFLDSFLARLAMRRAPVIGSGLTGWQIRPIEPLSVDLADEYGAPEGVLPAALVESLQAAAVCARPAPEHATH